MGNADYDDFDSLIAAKPPPSFDRFINEYAALTGSRLSDIEWTPWTARAFRKAPEGIANFSRFAPRTIASITYSPLALSSALASPASAPSAPKRRYKPVDRKYRPVPTFLPDINPDKYRPIPPPVPLELPHNPPPRSSLLCGTRLTRERLDEMLGRIEPGVLLDKEIDLIAWVLVQREMA